MPKQSPLADWFNANPEAARFATDWLARRMSGGETRGQRQLLAELRKRFRFPGTSQGTLHKLLHRMAPIEAALAGEAAREPAPEPAPKPEVHYRRTPVEVARLEEHGTYVVTCAQNNCEPEWPFLNALELYAKAKSARLVVIPMRYKNPTSRLDPQEGDSGDYWWHERLQPYLVENALQVHPQLVIQADVRIAATAQRPLAGLQSRSGGASAIYGHPQLTMETVATPQHSLPKLLYTTGSVTRKNYSRTRLGNLGEFHHTHAALVVEVRGDLYHIREVTWSRKHGCFIDLDTEVRPDGLGPALAPLALVVGDEHAWFNSPEVREATYDGPRSIMQTLRPKLIVRHDVFDCYSVSWHHQRNSLTRAIKASTGFDDLRRELDDTLRFIDATTPEWASNLIVFSNHHHQLTRWLESGEAHVEPRNLKLYHWLKFRVLDEAKMNPNGVRYPDAFEVYARDKLLTPTRFLGPDDSFQLVGVELGMHGHLGPNGTRGSLKNLSTIGTRSIIGHVHAPGIYQGAYAVGTSSYLRLDYNAGPSSWLNTHCLLHSNGKRQLVHVIRGAWRD